MKKLYFHHIILLILLLSLMAVASSFFIQYIMGIKPCPLCIFQRIAALGLVLASGIALLFLRRHRPSASILIALPTLFGLGVAIRHLYLQSLPADAVPSCGPGLNFMLQTMPLSSVFSKVLMGSGECANVEKFLYLPIPLWSLGLFGTVLILLFIGLKCTKST